MLRGEAGVESARVHPTGCYAAHGIEARPGRAVSLDPAGRVVHLDTGEPIPFGTAVLATGARPRRLAVPGADLRGVHYLRTAADAVRLRAAIATG